MTTRLGIAVVASLLAACGSSHVGGDDAGPPPDAVEFCRQREARVCARVYAIDRDDTGHMECVAAIDAMCLDAMWAAGCAPTQDALDACLAALVESARISVPPDELPECASICDAP